MDYAIESLKKTSDIERKATINKLHNMQWLKNTSHSANPYVHPLFLCLSIYFFVLCINIVPYVFIKFHVFFIVDHFIFG